MKWHLFIHFNNKFHLPIISFLNFIYLIFCKKCFCKVFSNRTIWKVFWDEKERDIYRICRKKTNFFLRISSKSDQKSLSGLTLKFVIGSVFFIHNFTIILRIVVLLIQSSQSTPDFMNYFSYDFFISWIYLVKPLNRLIFYKTSKNILFLFIHLTDNIQLKRKKLWNIFSKIFNFNY